MGQSFQGLYLQAPTPRVYPLAFQREKRLQP